MNPSLRTLSAGLFFCGILWGGTWPSIRGCADSVPDVFAQNQRLGRGVNILSYDPIWRAREDARFQARHFQLLSEAGFGFFFEILNEPSRARNRTL